MTEPDALAQINAKLDVLISQHGTTARRVDDHETRLRDVESRQTVTETGIGELKSRDVDQEGRLRKADRWRYAMPIAGFGSAGALLTGLAVLVAALGP